MQKSSTSATFIKLKTGAIINLSTIAYIVDKTIYFNNGTTPFIINSESEAAINELLFPTTPTDHLG